MGGFNPVSTVFDTLSGVIGNASTAYDIYGDYRDVAQRNRAAQQNYILNERDIAEKLALERKQQELEESEDKRQRQQNLQRSTAARKAAFGSQGISTTDGSGQAVLLGLLQESDEQQKYRDRLNNLRRDSMAQDAAIKRQRNLLSLQNTRRTGQNTMLDSIGRLF